MKSFLVFCVLCAIAVLPVRGHQGFNVLPDELYSEKCGLYYFEFRKILVERIYVLSETNRRFLALADSLVTTESARPHLAVLQSKDGNFLFPARWKKMKLAALALKTSYQDKVHISSLLASIDTMLKALKYLGGHELSRAKQPHFLQSLKFCEENRRYIHPEGQPFVHPNRILRNLPGLFSVNTMTHGLQLHLLLVFEALGNKYRALENFNQDLKAYDVEKLGNRTFQHSLYWSAAFSSIPMALEIREQFVKNTVLVRSFDAFVKAIQVDCETNFNELGKTAQISVYQIIAKADLAKYRKILRYSTGPRAITGNEADYGMPIQDDFTDALYG